jgi:hypothetical protein
VSKFNDVKTRPAAQSPVKSERTPSGLTYEGGPGYVRDAKGELFLLAVSNMVGENTFYEKAGDRDARYEALVTQVAVEDPEWTTQFLRWLRSEGNMRSASLVGAAEAAKAMLAAGVTGGRQIVDSVLQRADEPGELLAYWTSRHGRAIPKPVKRGVADAAARLYSERALLKYDTASHGFRFGDVLDLVHASPADGKTYQGDLFQVALDRRHGRDNEIPERLGILRRNALLRAEAAAGDFTGLLDATVLNGAGMTWEDVLSLAGPHVDKAQLWAAILPSMGIMALARNLRNLDEAGVPDDAIAAVLAKFSDPDEVARSRMFPFRWLAAYEQAPSLRWSHALDRALQASLSNLPALGGRSLILVDTSASMTSQRLSARSTMTAAKAAAVFGVALAARGERVDLHGFADGVFRHDVPKGASVIREVDRFVKRTGEVGHGTAIAQSLRATFRGHDRVFIISDMQTIEGPYAQGVSDMVPATVPLYGFNLAGYKHGAFAAGQNNRHEFGGLTDATFRVVPLLERGRDGGWPWMA